MGMFAPNLAFKSFGVIAILILLAFAITANLENTTDYTSVSHVFRSCFAESVGEDVTSVSASVLRQTGDFCYRYSFGVLALEDFTIRREKFIQQMYADKITLWMVVAVTFAGIALSGMQLLTSYRLAAKSGTASDGLSTNTFEWSKDKVVVSTSVAGVLILMISLAFFFVFVKYIYALDEIQMQRTADSPLAGDLVAQDAEQRAKLGPMVGGGGLGVPPPTSQDPTASTPAEADSN